MTTLIPDHSLDGESKTGLMMGLTCAFTFVNTAVVIARVYTRAVILHTFGIDDIFILITLVCGLNTRIYSFCLN